MNRPTVQLSVYSDMLKGPATHLVAGSGQIVHIWGASGAGKSTLLSRIWGSRSMGGGQLRVEIDGTTLDLAGMPAARLAFVRPRLMTYVEQRPTVLPRIRMRDWLCACSARQLQAGLKQLDLASGLLQRCSSDLSGGELQRFALLRAFCSPAPILLLDEPCTGLDRSRYEHVVELLRQAKDSHRLVIYTSHAPTSWADQELELPG
jgi:ABC-type lipoprotein export system ATPase subunit